MSGKYSSAALARMARAALAAKANLDPRWIDLVTRLSIRCNLGPRAVERAIRDLAERSA